MIYAKYPNPIWKTFIVKNQNFNKMVMVFHILKNALI